MITLITAVVFVGLGWLALKRPVLAIIVLFPAITGAIVFLINLIDPPGNDSIDHLFGLALLFSSIPVILGMSIIKIWKNKTHYAKSEGVISWTLKKNVETLVIFLLCIIFPVLLIVTSFVIFWLGGLLLLGLFALLAHLVIGYNLINRQARTLEILSVIGGCLRQHLPLATALEVAAGNHPTRTDNILRQIAGELAQGFSLSEALERGYRRCPGHVIALIAMAERVDQVTLAIRSLEQDLLEKARDRSRIKPVHPVYPIVVVTLTVMILTGIITFIVPKFRYVFEDFSLSLPSSLILWRSPYADWLVQGGIYLSLFLVILVPFGVYVKFRVRRAGPPRLLSRWGDWLKWHLPLLRGFERLYGLSQVLGYLHLALRAGATVDQAAACVGELDVNACYRQRLRKWSQRIDRGEDAADAARQCGLGALLAWAFDKNTRATQTPKLLGLLEEYIRKHYFTRLAVVRSVGWPLGILLVAAFVAFVAYNIFLPLVLMIEAVAATVFPV